jgi:LPS-assembly protein
MLVSLLFALGAAMTVPGAQPEVIEISEEDVLFTAERIDRSESTGIVIAEGDVRAAAEGRFVRADRVIYDPADGIITAEGNVVVSDENGQIYFAERVELTSDLANGIVERFETEFAPTGTLASAAAIQRDAGNNELRKATFTLCEVCDEGLRRGRPIWQLKARRAIQDENAKKIRFRDAFIELFGVPVFYTPYAEVPDPSVERATGILTPGYRSSTRRGNEFEIPFYVAISDYQDFTFTPRHFDELGTMFQGEYRRNTYNSELQIQAGVINPTNDLSEEAGNPDNVRWHWFSRYRRDLLSNWQVVADIDGVSDQGYLLTYDIEPDGDLRDQIAILRPDRLESNLTFLRQTENARTEFSSYLFQTLRLSEDQDFTAQALPRFSHEQYFDAPGGEITLGGSFLSLLREDGLDSFRASINATYRGDYTTKNGHRFEAFGQLRGDQYVYRNAGQGVQTCNSEDGFFPICSLDLPRDAERAEFNFNRFLPTIGAEWSYPLAKLGGNSNFIITPRVQAVVSPNRDFSEDVFNEDSQFFQFDTITLFDYNKATGLDLWEDGQRLNVGIETSTSLGSWLTVDTLLGTQFRLESTDLFSREEGIGEVQSDYVGAVDVRISNNIVIDNRFRIDDNTGSFRRLETRLSGRFGPLSGNLNYLRVEGDDFTADDPSELDQFLIVTAALRVNRNISIAARQAQNLDSGDTTNTEIAVRLAGRCSAVSVRYRFDDSTVAGFEQDEEILIRFDIVGFDR